MKKIVDDLLLEGKLKEFVDKKSHQSLLLQIFNETDIKTKDHKKIIRLLFLLINFTFSDLNKENRASLKEYFDTLYNLLKMIDFSNEKDMQALEEILGSETITIKRLYYFYLAAAALFADNTVKIRLDLSEYDPSPLNNSDWESMLINSILDAFIFLVRKDLKRNDIQNALEIINNLIALQKEHEPGCFNSDNEMEKQTVAFELLGLYHIAKMLTDTTKYLSEGYGYKGNIGVVISRHGDLAQQLLTTQPRLASIAFMLEVSLHEIIKNSIWFQTTTLGADIKQLCANLAKNNIIELLPSQAQALSQGVLDPASSATIIQMPTSAGKTLLAQFAILQAKALDPSAKIIYVVPTRALVNQVVFDLKRDFDQLKIKVEKTSVTIEIDPSENTLLADQMDVLVATPEKLDLLIRRKHPAVENVSLFVIDEAHSLRDGLRGARLEMLLAILKRERPTARFMLLSPFLKESGALLRDWLAGSRRKIAPISIDWKPAEKVLMGVKMKSAGRKIRFNLLPSAQGYKEVKREEKHDVKINLQLKSNGAKSKTLEYCAKKFGSDGKTLLILCYGPGSADSRAKLLSDFIEDKPKSDLTELAIRFIDEEIGTKSKTSELLRKGIAVHHSGLTDEIKLLTEHLVRKNEIRYICATTTITQGINFPVSAVYFDDYRKGPTREMDHNDFWNISGRAGRTMIDNYGRILLPFNTRKNENFWRNIVQKGASDLTSALAQVVLDYENIVKAFTGTEEGELKSKLFKQHEALDALIQYLVHLLNVSGVENYAKEIEELFKDSYGYFSISNESERQKFIGVCRAIYEYLKVRAKGALAFADKTGFSVPSVLKIMAESKNNPLVSNPETWNPKELFDNSKTSLTEKIKIIALLREVQLGTESKAAEFNPEMVAHILSDWVNGNSISNICQLHPYFKDKDEKDQLNKFIGYLSGLKFKASWGLSALEGIVKGNEADIAENSYVPSMVYFGVNRNDAIWLRMLGVPRGISNNMAKLFDYKESPKSYNEVRDRIKGLSSRDWTDIRPKNSTLSGEEWREVTSLLLQ